MSRRIENIGAGMRLPYRLRALANPNNWRREFKYDLQRQKRGWSDRDTWGGGEYLMEVSAGILRYLNDTIVDWPKYFELNFGDDNHGYTSLLEVADDLELHLWFQEHQFDDQFNDLNNEDRWAIEIQLQEQASNAMRFVASNIHGLWW